MRDIHLRLGKYEFKTELGASWIKLFYHNVETQSDIFDKPSVAEYVLGKKNQYSILSEVRNWSHPEKYEFLLQYPQYPGYNRWRQSCFPLDEEDNETKDVADGYENISCIWTDMYWGGLVKHGNNPIDNYCSLLKGSLVTNWYYAIGTRKGCTGWEYTKIPGPNNYLVNTVYLWMRVSDLTLLKYYTCRSNAHINYKMLAMICFLNNK